MTTTREIGQHAESIANEFLNEQGLDTVTTNYQTRFGEIDIIALDNQDLVFVEVRYRKNAYFGGAAASVNAKKQKRLLTSAELYIQQQTQHKHRYMRFDIIAIENQATSPGYKIQWIKNAFEQNSR